MTDTAHARVAQLRADARLAERLLPTAPPPPPTTGHGLQAVQRPLARTLLPPLTSPSASSITMQSPPSDAPVLHSDNRPEQRAASFETLLDSLDAPASPWFRVALWERLPWEGEFYADRQDQTLVVVVLPPTAVEVLGDRQATQCAETQTVVVVDVVTSPAVLSLPDGNHVVLERDADAGSLRIAVLSPTEDACRLPEPPLRGWLDSIADDAWLVAAVNREASAGPWGHLLATAILWRLSRSSAEETRRAIRRFASTWTVPQSSVVLRRALDDATTLRETLQELHAHALEESCARLQASAWRRDALEGVLVLLYAARHDPRMLHDLLAAVDAVAPAALLAFDDPDVLDPTHSARAAFASPGVWWTGALAVAFPDADEDASPSDD